GAVCGEACGQEPCDAAWWDADRGLAGILGEEQRKGTACAVPFWTVGYGEGYASALGVSGGFCSSICLASSSRFLVRASARFWAFSVSSCSAPRSSMKAISAASPLRGP